LAPCTPYMNPAGDDLGFPTLGGCREIVIFGRSQRPRDLRSPRFGAVRPAWPCFCGHVPLSRDFPTASWTPPEVGSPSSGRLTGPLRCGDWSAAGAAGGRVRMVGLAHRIAGCRWRFARYARFVDDVLATLMLLLPDVVATTTRSGRVTAHSGHRRRIATSYPVMWETAVASPTMRMAIPVSGRRGASG
jgi:hypothetical protein